MKKFFYTLVIAVAVLASCGLRQSPQQESPKHQSISTHTNAPGDSARYGLACDGCTDSILVFLPFSGGDPDTFDIINARHQRRIYGRPRIGDELAVIVNPEDPEEVLTVVNMERLKGTWCYMVHPKLRHIDNMPSRIRRRMLEHIPDSVRQQMMSPREYTLRLKRDHTAMHLGGMRSQSTTDDMSPVEFPRVRHYNEWCLHNGRLILKADTIAGMSAPGDKPVRDTADILLLARDSLVLQFSDHTQSYYRKVSTE